MNDINLLSQPQDDQLMAAIARQMTNSIREHMSPTKEMIAPRPPTDGWLGFAEALASFVASDNELQSAVYSMMARSARQALASGDGVVPSVSDLVSTFGKQFATRGGTVVRTFWWGFHIQVSHQDLQNFLAGAGGVNAIVGTIGGSIPSPAAPFIAMAAAFIAGALSLLKGLDRGNGVYVSMSWLAPGVFVPTSV